MHIENNRDPLHYCQIAIFTHGMHALPPVAMAQLRLLALTLLSILSIPPGQFKSLQCYVIHCACSLAEIAEMLSHTARSLVGQLPSSI